MARRRQRRKSNLENTLNFMMVLTMFFGNLLLRLILFVYDLITMHTSQYKQKAGINIFKAYFDKGYYGEFVLYRKLIRIFGKEHVYANLYLDNKRTDVTEIDVIAVSQKGVYVFEMKNYGGYIFGSQKNKNWTQVFNRFSKHSFYNPLRQNYAHTEAVKNFLNLPDKTLKPMVIFANRGRLKIDRIEPRHAVLKLKEAIKHIKAYEKKAPSLLNEEEVRRINTHLIEKMHADDEVKAHHLEQVKQLSS